MGETSVDAHISKDIRGSTRLDPLQGLQEWVLTDVGRRPEKGRQYPAGKSVETEKAQIFTNGSIVLLLESPHTNEMKTGQPAAGSTGGNIEALRTRLAKQLFRPMLDGLCAGLGWDKIPLVIANPCPYPTSCLAKTKDWALFRDTVFSRMFPLVAGNFRARLTKYRPLIILNACTGGSKAGMSIRSTQSGDFEIIEGESPKELVNGQIKTWLGTRCFGRLYAEKNIRQHEFLLYEEEQVGPCRNVVPECYWVDVGHPVGWTDRDESGTVDGQS